MTPKIQILTACQVTLGMGLIDGAEQSDASTVSDLVLVAPPLPPESPCLVQTCTAEITPVLELDSVRCIVD